MAQVNIRTDPLLAHVTPVNFYFAANVFFARKLRGLESTFKLLL